MTVKRTTQSVELTLTSVNPLMHVSQCVELVLSANALHMLTTQVCALMLSDNVPDDVTGNVNKYRQIQIAC